MRELRSRHRGCVCEGRPCGFQRDAVGNALGGVERLLDARQFFRDEDVGRAALLNLGKALVVRILEGLERIEKFFEGARGFPARPLRFEGGRVCHVVILLD
jgi:hypothetical protein